MPDLTFRVNSQEYKVEINVKEAHADFKAWPLVDREPLDLVVEGFVRFDGCMNFHDPKTMMHVCGHKDLVNLTTLLCRIHRLCLERIPGADPLALAELGS